MWLSLVIFFSLFENKTTDYLKEKISGDIRRYIVWALEEACVATDAFEDAGKLLGMLSIAENEQISNNASGVFLEKFHVALSGTQADLGKKQMFYNFFLIKALSIIFY